MSPNDLIAIAVIRRAVGLKGFCAIETIGSTFALIEPLVVVYAGRDENNTRELTIEEIEKRPKGFVCRFREIVDREGIEQLNGCKIFIPGENLPALGDGEYYHFELEGFQVLSDSTGALIGWVREVVNLPTLDALEIELKKGKTVLLPYNDETVLSVDMNKRQIVVKWSYVEELLW